jgi:MoaA/NifB/PqqE/SkfB family radical SAM enzyme/ferredoxin
MPEPVHFHTDIYPRDALRIAAEKYQPRLQVQLTDAGADVVARFEPLGATAEADSQTLRDEFCNEALSATVRRLRDLAAGDARKAQQPAGPEGTEPPWQLLAPFGEGTALGLGWALDSLGPIRGGAAVLVLRNASVAGSGGVARVTVRRNGGAPVGVAHTEHLDFMLMNGGGGAGKTDESIARVLRGLATALEKRGNRAGKEPVLALLLPHAENRAPAARSGVAEAPAPVAPRIDVEGRAVRFDFDDVAVSRPAFFDAMLTFADRSYVLLTRPDTHRIGVQLKARGDASAESLSALAEDVASKLLKIARGGGAPAPANGTAGLPALPRARVDLDKVIAELEGADPATVGVGFQPERGPGHTDMRVINVRGTGACNSECVFCVEKFNPGHRSMPKVDATRQFIIDAGGRYDMLFFASGEPTIHPKLFEHVELAKSVGFTCFGMSSHFRTFADPRFALRILQAGFEYFDISLHAATAATQLEVNPIDDGGDSLFEALKGLAVLYRLADALGLRISVTQKIVVSRLNVLELEEIFRATYERGVRHFILQPVRTLGLEPALQAKLAITEEEILPHLNELLRKTEGLGATVKPYGFSRQALFTGSHIETEQNRVKNIYGKARRPSERRWLPMAQEAGPTDGRHRIEVMGTDGQTALAADDATPRLMFSSDGKAPVLDTALDLGHDLPFGCRMGSCGMCCARLIEGRVDQGGQIFLTEEQTRRGLVLLCQARPLTDVVVALCTDDEIDQL